MIVATAGHIDHGKTALVKALTQVDTDRLEQEKQRGLSIDLGFAYADFGGALPLGFVDVPGHERFIRNMLAGVAAIDYALLVVAADDGPMPQTREHLAILDLLGITRGAIAITKIDRVSPSRREAVMSETQAMVESTSLAGAPFFPVSNITGEGLPALRAALSRAAGEHQAQPVRGLFRLAVDRGFSVKGTGWVVTGTVLDGMVHVGDRIVLSSAPRASTRREARVRSLRVHEAPADMAQAGQRCALNLAGDLGQAPIGRGGWLLAPALYRPTDRLDVTLRLSGSGSGPLKNGAQVQLHLGAAVRNGRVALLDMASLAANAALVDSAAGLAQLVLDEPVYAVVGDRFILRDPAAQRTLAGGRVIDPFGPRRGRGKPQRLALLGALAQLPCRSGKAALAVMLEESNDGVALERFAQAFNIPPTGLEELLQAADVETFAAPAGTVGMKRARVDALEQAVLGHLEAWHADNPESSGLPESSIVLIFGQKALDKLKAPFDERKAPPRPQGGPDLCRLIVARLLSQGKLVRNGLNLRIPSFEPRLSDADQHQLGRIVEILQASGLRPPIVGELSERLALGKPDLLVFLGRMHALGHLVRVAPNRYFLPATVSALADIAAGLARESATGRFDAAQFRDRSGIGRNLSIQVLEFLDRAGVTRFVNEQRCLR